MSNTRWRQEWIAEASRAGLPLETALKLGRYATTLHRLAEASCNGDWPADNGERKLRQCSACHSGWAPSSFARGLCPDCRTEDLVKRCIAEHNRQIGAVPCTCEHCPTCDAKTVCASCKHCSRCSTHAPGCEGCPQRDGARGFGLEFRGDPRGAVLSVVTPDGRRLAVW